MTIKELTKSFLIGTTIALCIGSIYTAAQTTITIPVTPADHEAYLLQILLGTVEDREPIQVDSQGNTVIIQHSLVAGTTESPNMVLADNGTIAGGQGNLVGSNAINSVIGAGLINQVNAPNSTIGAGEKNIIGQNAEGSFIG